MSLSLLAFFLSKFYQQPIFYVGLKHVILLCCVFTEASTVVGVVFIPTKDLNTSARPPPDVVKQIRTHCKHAVFLTRFVDTDHVLIPGVNLDSAGFLKGHCCDVWRL